MYIGLFLSSFCGVFQPISDYIDFFLGICFFCICFLFKFCIEFELNFNFSLRVARSSLEYPKQRYYYCFYWHIVIPNQYLYFGKIRKMEKKQTIYKAITNATPHRFCVYCMTIWLKSKREELHNVKALRNWLRGFKSQIMNSLWRFLIVLYFLLLKESVVCTQ